MSEKNMNVDMELRSKINLLGDEHKLVLNRFLDLFFVENSKAIKKNVIRDLMGLSDKMNKFAYEHGMTEEFAEQIIKEIS